MTKETDINIPDEKVILKSCLKDLCQHHYLPFTTTLFDSPEEIIRVFLETLNGENPTVEENGLFKSPVILGVVPGFHLLNNFQSWAHEPIDSYKVLSKVDEKLLSDIFTIQTSWASKINGETFSQKVIDTLNEGKKNGRVKVIIKLNTSKEIQVKYSKEKKTIEFLIPLKKHEEWMKNIPKIIFNKDNGKIIEINKTDIPYHERPNFPKEINPEYFIGFEREDEFRRLAEDIYPYAVEHSVYISSETSLLYLFSNNTEIDDKDVGLGGMFILLHKDIIENLDCPECKTIINYLSRLTDALSSRLINFYQIQEIKQHATRAAISQVMARNMSHNIGSHVLNNLTDGFTLSKIIKVECKAYRPSPELKDLKEEAEIIYQLSIYNHYVKCRMDYLSDVTFGTPVMHTNKNAFKDLYKDLDKVRLLLEHISGLAENFPYKIRFTKNDEQEVELNDNDDLAIAIPNDLLGCQAFYNIIENVIRNTAKHNQSKKNDEGKPVVTTFTVNFKDIPESIVGVEEKTIWYQVEIYDDVEPDKNIEDLVNGQNIKLNKSVLAENYQLRNESLGLLEMEASAAYLRKLDIINIEKDEYEIQHNNNIHTKGKLNILKAFSKKIENKTVLAYRFFISKPTEFLFVGEFDVTENEARVTELLKMGIWFRTESDFENDLKNDIVFNHQFIFHKSIQLFKKANINEKYITQLPIRILELNDDMKMLLTLIEANNVVFKEIERCVWNIWFYKIKGKYDVVNVITSFNPKDTNHTLPNRYNLVLLNHNNGWTNSIKDYNKNINFIEPLSSSGQKALPLFKNDLNDYLDSEWDKLKECKIFEAALSKVLVIDERIQRFSETKYEASGENNVFIKDIFNCTNVTIPDINLYPLAADNFNQMLVKSVCRYIKTQIDRKSTNKFDFILVHFSILERMFGSKDPRINKYLKLWAKSTRVVVTSGRGKPKELPVDVCYVNLSPILNVFIQTRSKYTINYLLNQARR